MRIAQIDAELYIADSEMVIEIPEKEYAVFSLELALLLSGLVNSVTFGFKCNCRLRLSVDPFFEAGEKAKIALDGCNADIVLSKISSEYLMTSIMRAYRDGFAEVDHIHVEGESGVGCYDLTIFFEKFYEPLSQGEAEKLLCE